MKLPKLEPDPNNFLPGEKVSLWRDPYWAQVVFMILGAALLFGGVALARMHRLWAYAAFFGIVSIFVGTTIYFGFIARAIAGGIPGVLRGRNAEMFAVIQILGILILSVIILGVCGSF